MSKFFRALALLVAVCCLTWVFVLWWWQSRGHSIEVQDVVIYLGLLPLALVCLLLGLRWAWGNAAARRAAAALAAGASAAGGGAPAAAGAHPAAEDQARHAVTQLVNVAICSVTGDQASDLLDAAGAGKPLPQPDGVLINDDGLPVLCARIPDKALPLDALRAEIDALLPLLRQQQAEWQGLEPGEDVLRALSALKQPLRSQQDWLMGHDIALKNAMGEGADALMRLPPSQRPPLPALRVLLGWPPHWTPFEQALARAWVEQALSDPQADLSAAHALSYATLAGSGEELWLRADQMSQPATRTPWLLVAACHSDVDQSRVGALSAAQRLYDASERPGGCMPGEAAAALLLAPADWVPPADMDLSPVRLHRPALVRRGKPVEATGRIAHVELAEVVTQALTAAQIEPTGVSALVCDADQHSQRGAELYGVAVDGLAHFDPVEDLRLLGRVTGFTGVASWLLVLAAAASLTKSGKKNTLALGMADSHLRMALVLLPGSERDAG